MSPFPHRRLLAGVTSATALTLALAACGSSSSGGGSTGAAGSGASPSAAMPTVKLMVGGIDKQIYLPYQLAQGLGYYQKYGVNVELSTEQNGGVGAEDAMISGQVDMAGAWYVHTIDFQAKGKDVIDVVQLSGAPGEREMCAKGTSITSPAQWKGKTVGVTDLGSGTDSLTKYMAAKVGLTTKDFTRVGVGAGTTLIAGLQHGKIVCGMTTQPTVSAIEKKGIGSSAFDLASTAGAEQLLGGAYPSASVLARADWVSSHRDAVQKVVDALVATMHYINTHSASDIADHLPKDFVENSLVTRADYVAALTQDKGQFLPDGMMPANGPATVLKIEKFVGNVTGNVDLSKTYTNDYAIAANKLEGFAG